MKKKNQQPLLILMILLLIKMDHVLDVFKKDNIKPGELEEIWGEEGVQRLKELLEENVDKYEILKNNEILKKISKLTNSDSAKSIFLTYMEYVKLEEVKEGLKYENAILTTDLKLEKDKRIEYENTLKDNDLITDKSINEFDILKQNKVLVYSKLSKRKPLSRLK